MPAAKKTVAPKPVVVEEPVREMCDNHPDVVAAHTTGSRLHQPISLCQACLSRVEHMKQR